MRYFKSQEIALEYTDEEQCINRIFHDDYVVCLNSKGMDLEEKFLQKYLVESAVDGLSNGGGCRYTKKLCIHVLVGTCWRLLFMVIIVGPYNLVPHSDAFVSCRHGMLLVSYKPASNESSVPTSRVPLYIHVGGIRNYIHDEVFLSLYL